MAVTTCEYLITAIEESLCELTGRPRALTAPQLFTRGLPQGFPADTRVRDAGVATNRKTCFVGLGPRSDDGNQEIGADHRYAITIWISRDYWIGFEGSTYLPSGSTLSEVKRAFKDEADDFMRIRKALCWPGALATTIAGQATGLESLALDGTSARSTPRIESVPDGGKRLLNCIDTFTAHLLFDAS